MSEDNFEQLKGRPAEFSKFEDENTDASIAAIKSDIEDDLYNRDGDTNEVGTAMQRLQALAGAGKLTANFSQVASGLGQMVDVAIEKKERRENERALAAQQDQLEDKKRDDAEKAKDGFDDALDQVEQQRKRDAATTLSERQLDAMEWKGDAEEVWSFNGKEGSRKSWYEAAREMRRKLDKLASENNWTDSERTQQEKALSDFMKAQKNDDQPAAQQAWGKMKPETQQAVERERKRGLDVGSDISAPTVAAANDIRANAMTSTGAGAEMLASAQADVISEDAPVTAVATGSIKESALRNPPDVKLTEEFSLAAAADEQPSPTPERQPQLAALAATPKTAAPVLSQEFSI